MNCACVLLSMIVVGAEPSNAKRPLTHADYDIWNRITDMTLAPNGQWIAYSLAPPKGDATVIVRNTSTGAEWKFAKGGVPSATTPGESGKTPTPAPGEFAESTVDEDQVGAPFAFASRGTITGVTAFTPDSKFLYFVRTPTKAETDKATAENKKPDEMPKPALAVLDTATGKIVDRITGIKSFRVTGTGAGLLILTRDSKPDFKEAKPESKPEAAPMPRMIGDQEPKKEEPKKDEPKKEESSTTRGSDIVIRDLGNGQETTWTDVGEYVITRDFAKIVMTDVSKKPDVSGVYYANLFEPAKREAVFRGKGRFYRLTWDEAQHHLAFFHDDAPQSTTSPSATPPGTPPTPNAPGRFPRGQRPTTPATTTPGTPPTPDPTRAKPKVYLWERPAKGQPITPAVLVLGPETIGLRKGWQLTDRGGLSFSADGVKLRVSVMPEPEKPAEPKKAGATPTTSTTDKVELDIWHWKDELLQPMQKVQSPTQRARSFSAAYLIDSKKFVPLGDEDRTLVAPDYGDWGVGTSNKKYRALNWDYPPQTDYSLVNIRTGETKPVATVRSALTLSPHAKYLAGFDGKQWFTISVPEGRRTVLTAKLKAKFAHEDFDKPEVASSYGSAGWSSDDMHLFVYDKHDIWKLAADGSEAVNLTGGGDPHLRHRLLRVEKPEEDEPAPERERGLDVNRPWLLATDNLKTHHTGFHRLMPSEKPRLLTMGAHAHGPPVKAKKAGTMLFTVSSFADGPDHYTSNADFQDIRRQTDCNPHKAKFNWATIDTVNYTSLDGQKLTGLLVKPEDFDASKKYPLIVYIYERLSQNVHQYREPNVRAGQVINPLYYASNGYLVLMPDIAYKIGYPGQSALNCVLPAIQAVADHGYVDEAAIGINGQSWGGYQIAYMITQTTRFKAAVAGAAVTNMTSAYNGIRWGSGMARQFQYERDQSRIGATLWEAPMKYIENSPVFFADRVATPVMMINNDADDAVPWYQGIEFYLSLRRLGKEVYMLNYNDEKHNLRKVANARDFAVRMQQFFDHHLKGAPMPDWMAKGVPYAERDKEKEQMKKMLGGVEKK
jgi:dipeptidyl aminopeptidase/acylaminoacyl peptidase